MEGKYIISDVSKLIEVEPHVLRYWEEELSLNIERNQLGHRYYSQSDIEMLKKIKELKEQGLQLKAIKVILNSENRVTEGEGKEKSDQSSIAIHNNNSINTSNKLQQFQLFMKSVFEDALKENNEVLKEEISDKLSLSIKAMMSMQEEQEEKRFRKLDETIREIQKSRQEVAVSKNKIGFFRRKKISP